jgi:two-component system, OmpR family, sensor histidine kinase SenX3
MRLPAKQSMLGPGLIVTLSMVLIALAVLQYRWSGEVSQAASTRMQASLDTSIRGFKHDFYQELGGVCFPFQTSFISTPDWVRYARHYDQWKASTSSFDLVKNVFVWQTAPGQPHGLLRLDGDARRFVTTEWPPEFVRFHERIASIEKSHGGVLANPSQAPQEFHLDTGRLSGSGANNLAWEMDQSIPALIHPLLQYSVRPGEQGSSEAQIIGWIMIQIDSETLRSRLLPELVQRYFSGPNGLIYKAAVLAGPNSDLVVYSSDADFGAKDRSTADSLQNLMSVPPVRPSSRDAQTLVPSSGGFPDGSTSTVFPDWSFYRPGGPPILQVLRYPEVGREWQLLVRHRRASLESLVAGLRYRTLGISFSVLALLATSVALLFVTSQRVHRLAKLQMDFVTCVSHELRTPVAVICSTAENLADGVVDGRKQVMRYGGIIRNQARELADLVERILSFAAVRDGAARYSLRPLNIAEIVDRALSNTTGLIDAAGMVLERGIDADLPPVMGDYDALVRCVQNLITNAVKYASEGRWIGVHASQREKEGQCIVEVTVEDRGPGIELNELENVFEPFYRGRFALAQQIHGTGLGLALARDIAQAMRGTLSVKSTPGTGCAFTLQLPAVKTAPDTRTPDRIEIPEAVQS